MGVCRRLDRCSLPAVARGSDALCACTYSHSLPHLPALTHEHPSLSPVAHSGARTSISSHALGACWWAEYAIDEEEEGEGGECCMVLPEGLWSIAAALQPGVKRGKLLGLVMLGRGSVVAAGQPGACAVEHTNTG